jgi:putative restriction endonuclease
MQAGISGSKSEGADSIVLSGGYEDDVDLGDTIVYTGHGGQDPVTRRQVADQKLERGNLALARSATQGLPIRVVRGPDPASPFAPESGYRYDGLYRVEDFWSETGKSGFRVCRFRLVGLEFALPPQSGPADGVRSSAGPPERVAQTLLRVVRDTALSRQTKHLYNFTCQVCGSRLVGPAGPYAEAAHIRPLGQPHNGPDSLDNLLCLCPNHHVLFDLGAFQIADDFSLIGLAGRLQVLSGHTISLDHIRYHRQHYSVL